MPLLAPTEVHMVFYALLVPLWVGAVGLAGLWRVLRGIETWRDWRERMGLVPAPETDQPYIWLHAASNGELASVAPVLTELARQPGAAPVVITTNSLTGRDKARAMGYPARLAPVDRPGAARRLMSHARAYVPLEAEIWPNRHIAARRAGVPVIMLGTRLSPGTARSWGRFAALARQILRGAELIVPQDPESRDRLIGLGATPDRVTEPLNFKALYRPPTTTGRPAHALDTLCPSGHCWLAASTHEGEDAVVLDAHRILLDNDPGAVLILAPRHVARADAIARLAEDRGLSVTRYSTGAADGPASVLLADTMGDMALWYDRAFACFVGGSLVPAGGHTPYEPLAHGAPVLHGPHVANFAPVYAALDAATSRACVTDAPGLAHRLGELQSATLRSRWLATQRGAVDAGPASAISLRIMAHLAPSAHGLEIKQ